MRRLLILPLACLLLSACSSETPPSVAGACVVAARVGDVLYVLTGPDAPPEVVGAEYMRTQRHRDCDDVIVTGDGPPPGQASPWRNGDAGGLPPGTPLHLYQGSPASERLLVNTGGVWREMRPYPGN